MKRAAGPRKRGSTPSAIGGLRTALPNRSGSERPQGNCSGPGRSVDVLGLDPAGLPISRRVRRCGIRGFRLVNVDPPPTAWTRRALSKPWSAGVRGQARGQTHRMQSASNQCVHGSSITSPPDSKSSWERQHGTGEPRPCALQMSQTLRVIAAMSLSVKLRRGSAAMASCDIGGGPAWPPACWRRSEMMFCSWPSDA